MQVRILPPQQKIITVKIRADMGEMVENRCIYCGKSGGDIDVFCSDLCKKDCDEEFGRAMEALEKYENEVSEHNNKMLSEIGGTVFGDLEALLDGSVVRGEMSWVKKPKGNNQDESWGVFKEVYVEQWSVGMEGDSWEGHIYGKIGFEKWLKIPYEC